MLRSLLRTDEDEIRGPQHSRPLPGLPRHLVLSPKSVISRDFQAAIQEVLDGLSTKYSQQLASLMTLNFQQFEDVSLMAA